MAKQFTHRHTPESLKKLDRASVETIRANAERLEAADVVAMCDEELTAREPARANYLVGVNRRDDVVIGYHFVCGRDLGVSDAGNGRFWSGSWVVAEERVEASVRVGGYLALHESRAEPSYRQGKIVGFRKAPRHMVAKRNEGIEFLVEATETPLLWVGDGTGEKGYKWASQEAEDGQ